MIENTTTHSNADGREAVPRKYDGHKDCFMATNQSYHVALFSYTAHACSAFGLVLLLFRLESESKENAKCSGDILMAEDALTLFFHWCCKRKMCN